MMMMMIEQTAKKNKILYWIEFGNLHKISIWINISCCCRSCIICRKYPLLVPVILFKKKRKRNWKKRKFEEAFVDSIQDDFVRWNEDRWQALHPTRLRVINDLNKESPHIYICMVTHERLTCRKLTMQLLLLYGKRVKAKGGGD